MNQINSCKLTVDYLFMLHSAFLQLTKYKVTWLIANLTALYNKTANYSIISTDWSKFWHSATSCYVLHKCVIFKSVFRLTLTGLTLAIIKQNMYRVLQSLILVTVTRNSYKVSQSCITLVIYILITQKQKQSLKLDVCTLNTIKNILKLTFVFLIPVRRNIYRTLLLPTL